MRHLILVLAALLLAAPPARAGELSYAARHGKADFLTAHLYPGASIVLAPKQLRENIAALTFDDGPDGTNDPEILRILAEHGAPATFFVVGRNAARHPRLLREIAAAGHEIGNHTFEHVRLITQNPQQQDAALRRTNTLLSAAGVAPRWFRPPFGSYDEHTLSVARANGLETILWTIDSKDYRDLPAAVVEERVMRDLAPGSVVLMHSNHRNTVEALPNILARARMAGVRFVTLTEWKALMERATVAQAGGERAVN
ncbi:MAG TPA: polysaccharide deacetylase family protein [Azospirillum sp.]|nr:polysaccharide deacetylase family protein [Azospirillum sp.]